jgi:hypothetical protein
MKVTLGVVFESKFHEGNQMSRSVWTAVALAPL